MGTFRQGLFGTSPLTSHSSFLREGVLSLIHQINSHHDRGLIASPVGVRDTFETFLRLLHTETQRDLAFSPLRPQTLKNRKILIITRGQDNFTRWQTRLNEIFQDSAEIFNQDRFLWNSERLEVRLESIDTLCRLEEGEIQSRLGDSSFVTLDQEHHIRGVDDDPADQRNRYIHVLHALGFVESAQEEFRAKANPGKFLLGLSESVREGAGRLYQGASGLISSVTLSELRQKGIVRKPEIREIVPEGSFDEGMPLTDRWASLKRTDRLNQYTNILNKVVNEFEKIPRTIIYASSQKEALALKRRLEEEGPYKNQVALLTSDSEERDEDYHKFFVTHEKRIVISVLSALEGVDEYRHDPVDLVLYAGVDYAGGETYALQAFGGHLGGTGRVPLMIDVSGLFELHEELAGFDPYYYVISDGELKKGSPLKPRRTRTAQGGKSSRVDRLDEYVRDVFDEEVAGNTGTFLEEQGIISAVVAMNMGISEERVRDVLEGKYLPGSREWMERLSVACGFDEEKRKYLMSAWAWDRAETMERRHPIPETLEEGERFVLSYAWYGLYLYFGGNLDLIQGSQKTTLLDYLHRGKLSEQGGHRKHFVEEVIRDQLLGGDEFGEALVAMGLGMSRYRVIQHFQDFSSLSEEDLAGYLKAVRLATGKEDEHRFALVGQPAQDPSGKKVFFGFRPVAVDELEAIGENYLKITLELMDGKYHVREAKGRGSPDCLDALRENPLAGNQVLVPTNARLKIQKQGNAVGRDIFKNLGMNELDGYLERVRGEARASGKSEKEVQNITMFALVGKPEQDRSGKEVLSGFRPVAVDELETMGENYLKITLELMDGKYHVRGAKGRGSPDCLDALRENPLAGNQVLVPTNARLKIQEKGNAVDRDIFKSLGMKELDGYLERVRREARASGKSEEEVQNITMFALVGQPAQDPSGKKVFFGFRPVAVDELKTMGQDYLKITLELMDGKYHVRGVEGNRATHCLDALRENTLAGDQVLVPTNARLKIREQGNTVDRDVFKSLGMSELDGYLKRIRREARASGKSEKEVQNITMFALVGQPEQASSGKKVFSGFRPVAVDELKTMGQAYLKITLELMDGKYHVRGAKGRGSSDCLDALRENPSFLKDTP